LDLLGGSSGYAEAKTLENNGEKLFGLLMPADSSKTSENQSDSISFASSALSSGREKKAAKAVEEVIEVKLSDDKLDENPLVHSFEKVHTAEEYSGGKKTLDGSDELDDHAEALDELNLRHVIRSRDRAESVYRAGYALESGAPDLEDAKDAANERGIFYDEWNDDKKTYRPKWCEVRSRKAHDSLEEPMRSVDRRQVKELREALINLTNDRKWRSRQIEGPEIDLDAVVDYRATLKSGHSPSNRLYQSRRRHERDVATLVLMDLSLSTDSWIENERVLDITRDSVLILSDVLDGLHDKTAIGGFYSNTRRDCRYLAFKDFDEPWGACRRRLTGVRPTGYTRIGPALRHATALLSRVPAQKRLLLLISDGKPTDYDRYEGRYGIADVKHAIREAHALGIGTRALAIDAEAKFYLPQMFGHGNYEILSHPSRLASCLTKIYAEVLR
jgi:nitric oxide reductase NorD protein